MNNKMAFLVPNAESWGMRKLFANLDHETRSQLLLLVDIAIAICGSAAVVGVLQMVGSLFWN